MRGWARQPARGASPSNPDGSGRFLRHVGEFVLDQLAVFQPQHAVHALGQFVVVRGDDGDDAGLADELQELLEDALGGLGVEIAGRLVGEQDQRGVGDGAGDGDALLLAAGQLGRAGASCAP